jgi:stearoyl-CoA desaturase (delta-9 desaturase)
MGEGWHNNHHFYPTSTRQGFYWWEIDLTYYGLYLLSKIGLIWDLKKVPLHILEQGLAQEERAEAAA